MRKIYFAGSIRGGRADAKLYHDLIQEMQKTDIVLTERVGDLKKSILEQGRSNDEAIYLQDTAWLKECDLVIAECTCPSLGVGYELAYAEKYNKPVYIFYRHSVSELSAMLTGDKYYKIYSYETKEELFKLVHSILEAKTDE